jgi:hypothetical protein
VNGVFKAFSRGEIELKRRLYLIIAGSLNITVVDARQN